MGKQYKTSFVGNTRIEEVGSSDTTTHIYRMNKKCFEQLSPFVDEYIEIDRAGIYLMFNASNSEIYIGQAGVRKDKSAILKRIGEPHDIDWQYVIIVVDDEFTAKVDDDRLKYLERVFYALAEKSKCYKVTNDITPCCGSLEQKEKRPLNAMVKRAIDELKYFDIKAFHDTFVYLQSKRKSSH